jgi:hypothetical protein
LLRYAKEMGQGRERKTAGGGGDKSQIIARAEHVEKIGIITPGFLQYAHLLHNNGPANNRSERQR